MNLLEANKPKIQGEIVVYGGRFQPFHKGHYDAYQRLVNEFGSANVYIATSNDTSSDKSPFSFNEKKEIATKMFGVPSSKFVKVSNPYRPTEILKKYDGKTIAYIAAVGDKDATRLQGKYFKPYKGKAGYGYDEIGYTYPIPAEENPISGTQVRRGLGSNDKEKAKKFFLKAYPKFDKDIFKMISTKLNEDGMPGGIGVGLVLPGGYINGAPTGSKNETLDSASDSAKYRYEPHPTRHEREHPSDEPDWHKKNKPYSPVDELKDEINEFITQYFNEGISESKQNSINHFVEYATKKLKLSERPKITLLTGKEYSEAKTSLGGYNPMSKEIFVVVDGRLTADILRTLAHEMVHRKQDELGLVKDEIKDGATGSPIENQAHAVAGILMRNYGKINKQIYNEATDTGNHGSDGIHNNHNLSWKEYDNPTKGYVDMLDGWEVKGHLSDDLPEEILNAKLPVNTHIDPKKAKGTNHLKETTKNEDINIDVDKGDTVLMGKFKNKKVVVKDFGKDDHGMPTINGKVATTFRLGQKGQNVFDKDGTVNEMGNNDIHFKNIIQLYRNTKFRKRINAFLFGNPNNNNPSAVAKALRNMGYDDITHMEKELNIEPNYDEQMDELYKDVENFIDSYLGEVSINTQGDAEADGGYVPKGKKRVLDGQDGVNKSEEWFSNGGYTQTEFPKADAIFGDDEGEERTIKHTIKNLPDVEYVETDFLKEGLLLEGGAYGHMSHPFDDMDLTFGDLKDIISKALNGDLGVVREKTDGQALAISWKTGRLIAARNKGHLANAGANAMGIDGVSSKFQGRGGLTDAYNFAMKDLSAAISSLSDAQRKKIFNEGKCFMNLEVIWPTSVNVIPYGQALLVFHNTVCYNESGVAVGSDNSAASTLAGMIKQVNADVQSKYTIQGPPITSIPKSDNLSSKQSKYLSKLSKLQSEFGLKDNDNVADYHQSWWDWWITSNAPVKVDKLTKEALIRRWAFGDKSFRLNTISNLELQKWAIDHDKINVVKQQKDNIKPFEEIFLGVGADVLEFVSSVLTVHPDNAIRVMKSKLKSVAAQVRNGGNPSQIQKLKTELQRLNALGGIDKIVANEGLVFFYNGKTYKLTGTFAPLNQILGIFYS